jgi:transcriptional regulator with XRE-family HTH domain
MNNGTTGQRMRQRRQELCLAVDEVVFKMYHLGCRRTAPTYRTWESDKVSPRVHDLAVLALVLETTITYLVMGTPPETKRDDDATPSRLQHSADQCHELLEVRPERVDDIRRCFEFSVSDGDDTAELFTAWKALTKDRQAQLLQYLSGLGMLQVKP